MRRWAASRCSAGGIRSSSASSRSPRPRRHAEVCRRGHEARAEADDGNGTTRGRSASRSTGSSAGDGLAARCRGVAAPRLRLPAELAEGARAGRRAVPRQGDPEADAAPRSKKKPIASSRVRRTTPRRRRSCSRSSRMTFARSTCRSAGPATSRTRPRSCCTTATATIATRSACLLALASSQGIKGRAVLVRTGKVPVISSVPTLAQFDRMIAKLDVGGKDVWVDPSDEHGQYGVAFAGQDNLVLPLDKGGVELGSRPALDPSTWVSHTKAQFTLSPNGDLDGEVHVRALGLVRGSRDAELRPLKGELADRFFQQQAAGMSASARRQGPHRQRHALGHRPGHRHARRQRPGLLVGAGQHARVRAAADFTLGVADDEPSASLSTRKTRALGRRAAHRAW